MTDNKEKIKQEYLSELYNDYRYSIEKFDSQSLYIGSGALALSLTFIKDIVPIEFIKLESLYYVSVFLFVISILLGFIAHIISAKLIKKRISEISLNNFKIPEDKIIPRLNKFVAGILIAGIFFLSVFSLYNFSEYQTFKKKQKMSEENVKNDDLNEIYIPKVEGEKLEEKAMTVKPIPQELKDPKPEPSTTQESNTNNDSNGDSNNSTDNK